MIYIAAIFFGCGLMQLICYMWQNYADIIIGADLAASIASSPVVSFMWSGTHIVFALAAVLIVSVPAVKQRDITSAGLFALVFGGAFGLGCAGLALAGGNVSSLLEFAQIIITPIMMSLLVSVAGFAGGMLTCPDVLARFSPDRGIVLANDNHEQDMGDWDIVIEKVLAPNAQYVRIFDSSHRTQPGEGALKYAGQDPRLDEQQCANASGF